MNNSQKGFVVSIVTFFVLVIMLSIAVSMGALIFYRQRIVTNSVKSVQSYYAAESGIEDALLRLNNNPSMAAITYNLPVNTSTTSITIPSAVGGSRSITSQGDNSGINRKIQAVFNSDSEGIAFHYGVQIGAGGLTLNSNSEINGNVFSDGNISGGSNSFIANDVIISGASHTISNTHVGGNVLSYSCSNSTIDGTLTYVSPGGTNTCTVSGGVLTQTTAPSSQGLPITQVQIDDWKAEATAGGVTVGNVSIGSNQTASIGPTKITGNLTIGSNVTLTLTGTLYVVGSISVGSNATVKLDSGYGSLGGILLSDGVITVNSNTTLRGTGQAGSYLLVLSTSSANPAIGVGSNSSSAVFYTSAGTVTVNSNASVKEVTGYRVSIGSNASVDYESGLANAFFSSGPSASWSVASWQEK